MKYALVIIFAALTVGSAWAMRSTVPQVPNSDFAVKWWMKRFDSRRN